MLGSLASRDSDISLRTLRGFVVSAHLRNTCWLFYKANYYSLQISAKLPQIEQTHVRIQARTIPERLHHAPRSAVRPRAWRSILLCADFETEACLTPFMHSSDNSNTFSGICSPNARTYREKCMNVKEHAGKLRRLSSVTCDCSSRPEELRTDSDRKVHMQRHGCIRLVGRVHCLMLQTLTQCASVF